MRRRPPLAFGVFGLAWLGAVTVLGLLGRATDVVNAVATAAIVAVLIGIVLLITRGVLVPHLPPADQAVRIQVGFLGALVAFSFVRFGPPAISHATGFGYLPGSAYAIVVFLLPLAVVVALGARGPELGLRVGGRALAVGLAMVAVRALMLAPEVAAGDGGRLLMVGLLGLVNTTAPEDLLFRGMVQSRLTRLLGPSWGLVLASLCFGLWHFGINAGATGSLGVAAARCVVEQGTIGLAYGTAFARTGSVVPGALAHAAFNTA